MSKLIEFYGGPRDGEIRVVELLVPYVTEENRLYLPTDYVNDEGHYVFTWAKAEEET